MDNPSGKSPACSRDSDIRVIFPIRIQIFLGYILDVKATAFQMNHNEIPQSSLMLVSIHILDTLTIY